MISNEKLNTYYHDNIILGSAFGTRENRRFTYTGKVNLHAGMNRIALLSVAVGLPVGSISPPM